MILMEPMLMKTSVMNRPYNFGAGPAMLPESILLEAQEEFLDWHQGMSVMEVGHRSEVGLQLLRDCEQSLRALLTIPTDYHVLFLSGAARTQFAMIPLNFLHNGQQGGYIISGIWSQLAFQEAQLLKKAYCIAREDTSHFTTIPRPEALQLQDNTTYVYYTPNETVNGVRFPYVPKTNGISLIADMTSCLLSEPIDVKQYALIFAGAQKNIANAGLTVVIVRDDLLQQMSNEPIPTMLNYKIQAEHHSLYATPPVFNCYLAAKMFAWIKKQGGVDTLFQYNCRKAALLYQYLDAYDFYRPLVSPEARSIVNICFSLAEPSLEPQFIAAAEQRGLLALKGHRAVGGIRASLYNAMPITGVEALISFMDDFAKEHRQ